MGAIGEALEVFQEEVEQGVSAAKQQITGKPVGQSQAKQQSQPPPQQKGQNNQQDIADQAGNLPPEATPVSGSQDDPVKKFVQDLYGGNSPQVTEEEIRQKELEDKKKQEELRQKLHAAYYQPLVNSPKQQEERQGEKIEREEEEKKMEEINREEEEKKKELPIIVTKDMGTKEKLRGVSG